MIDETPLLEAPLQGLAYAVSGLGGGVLPHLAFILGGQVTVMPEGESTTVNGGDLKTSIPIVPDVPIGHFRLTLFGGRQGYLSNTQSLCGSPIVSTVEFNAQNGKKLTQQVKTKTACKAKKKKQSATAPSAAIAARTEDRPRTCSVKSHGASGAESGGFCRCTAIAGLIEMMRKLKDKLTYANVMASVAVFIALGGLRLRGAASPPQQRRHPPAEGRLGHHRQDRKRRDHRRQGRRTLAHRPGHQPPRPRHRPQAANATNAANANTVGGHAASCPAETTLIRGLCFDSQSNPEAPNLEAAARGLRRQRAAGCRARWSSTPPRAPSNWATASSASQHQFTDTLYSAPRTDNELHDDRRQRLRACPRNSRPAIPPPTTASTRCFDRCGR